MDVQGTSPQPLAAQDAAQERPDFPQGGPLQTVPAPQTAPIPQTPAPAQAPTPSQTERRARDIMGLPVITFNRGSKIYDVEDMILDPARPQVLALLVEEKSLFHSAKVIPFGYINAIGPDAVIVPDGKAVVDLDRLKDRELRALNNDQIVRGLRVLTDDGRKLGSINDMLIDTKTGEIKGYYMSIGRVLDVTQGERYLPAANVINVGRRVLYISPETGRMLDEQVGGWSGSLEGAGSGLRTAGARANNSLLDLGDRLKTSGNQLNQQLGQYGSQVPQKMGSVVLGRTAHENVTAPDGTVIAKAGDTITQDQIDAANASGRTTQLFLAAGVGPAREHASNFSTEASDTWERTRTEARSLWSQLVGGQNTMMDQADERSLQRRARYALGRPVNRVILDRDDSIILNTGDIITNRSIEAARDAGVLDLLVTSVYDERPKLSLEDLKAPRSGEASLENVLSSGNAGALPPPSEASRRSGSESTETVGAEAPDNSQ